MAHNAPIMRAWIAANHPQYKWVAKGLSFTSKDGGNIKKFFSYRWVEEGRDNYDAKDVIKTEKIMVRVQQGEEHCEVPHTFHLHVGAFQLAAEYQAADRHQTGGGTQVCV